MENIIKIKGLTDMTISSKTDEELMRFSAIITTSSCDREGEVLLPSGAQLKNFMENPVLLFNHELDKPVGKVINLANRDDIIVAEFQMVKGDPLSEKLWNLVKNDVLKAVSVGFLKKEVRKPTAKDKQLFGEEVKAVVSKYEVVEISLVSVGCNQDAIIYDHKTVETALKSEEIVKKTVDEVCEKGVSLKKDNIKIEVDYNEILSEFKALYQKELKKIKGQLY